MLVALLLGLGGEEVVPVLRQGFSGECCENVLLGLMLRSSFSFCSIRRCIIAED
jgi:hypothetical protein